MKRVISVFVVLLLVGVFLLSNLSNNVVQAAGLPGYLEYYIPGDENDIMNALKDIPNSGVNLNWNGTNINSRVDIISSGNNINVYLDEHEDGYDFNPSDPYNTADAKWCMTDGTELNYGDILSLTETDTFVPGSEGVDGGDRFYITGGWVNLVRTVWPDYSPGTYIAGSWELYPTYAWQSSYTVPVGADTQLPSGNYPFEYTYLFVQAQQDNTRVVIEDPYTGATPDVDTVLNKGQNLMYPQNPYPPQGGSDNTCHQGTAVTATDNTSEDPVPIQANITTSANHVYDFRYYTLTPVEYLGNSYLIPVPSMAMTASEASSLGHTVAVETAIYIYSFQDNTDIWVETSGGSTQLDSDLDAGEVIRYVMPQMDTNSSVFQGDYGARIYINNPGVNDKIWVLGAGDDNNPDLDWGFQVLNPDYVSNNYFLPWAPSNPTYLTPLEDSANFYVDWDFDGTSDQSFTLDRLEIRMLYPPSTANPKTGDAYDGTGAHIWADKKFVIAWGQDYTEHTTGPEADGFPPDYDWGHILFPIYCSIGDRVWNDANGDGVQDVGEVGINGVTVDLIDDLNGNGVIDGGEPVLGTQTTAGDGDYDFTGLSAGDYIVDVTDTGNVLTGFTLTTTDPWAVTGLTAGQDYDLADFGYQEEEQELDLWLVKTVDNSTPNLGGNVVFTITVTNDGPNTATNVAVGDILPSGLTYVSDDGGGNYDNISGIWTVGTLTLGNSATLHITAQAPNIGTFKNTAEVTACDQHDLDSTPNNHDPTEDDQDSATVTTIFIPPPIWKILAYNGCRCLLCDMDDLFREAREMNIEFSEDLDRCCEPYDLIEALQNEIEKRGLENDLRYKQALELIEYAKQCCDDAFETYFNGDYVGSFSWSIKRCKTLRDAIGLMIEILS